jgi:hypothetical protein
MNEIAPTFARAVSSTADEPELIELAPGETSLDFLQRVYRSVKQPMSRRMRAAIEALPHEHPRLGAVAVGYLSGDDFASRLDRAIERSSKIKQDQADRVETNFDQLTMRLLAQVTQPNQKYD